MEIGCHEFRQIVGAQPGSREPGVLRHRLACRACNEHARALEALDTRLARALAVPVPEGLAERVLLAASLREHSAPRRYALIAAALVAAVTGALALHWYALRQTPLPEQVIAHLAHEPELLVPTAFQAPRAQVRTVVARGGATLVGDLGHVGHAVVCLFRGRLVPHLVIETSSGPVTVLMLPGQSVTGPMPLDEDGYRGVILPAPNGSIAVLGHDPAAIAEVRARFFENVRWDV